MKVIGWTRPWIHKFRVRFDPGPGFLFQRIESKSVEKDPQTWTCVNNAIDSYFLLILTIKFFLSFKVSTFFSFQFGIIALNGGMLRHPHFEVMRMGIGRSLKINETFAIYRVEAPYKPITNHGQGKRMGGGKGAISEYGTPVRAGRIIVEVGGNALWSEVQPWLSRIAGKMPFDALAVNKEMLDSIRAEEQELVETNQNPISFEWLVRNNMLDCQRKLSTYDKIWFGKFAYLDRHLNKKFQWVTGPRYKGKR